MGITHRVRVEEGLYAELRELAAEEISGLAKLTASSATQGWDLTERGLALSLKKLGERTFEPKDLQGADLDKAIGKAKWLLKLRLAWDAIHMAQPEDLADIKAMAVVVT